MALCHILLVSPGLGEYLLKNGLVLSTESIVHHNNNTNMTNLGSQDNKKKRKEGKAEYIACANFSASNTAESHKDINSK